MDVSAIAGLATDMSNARVGQDIGIAVLKKALDAASTSATELIDALPAPNLPSHLGQTINTTA
jgi:hypothetical protein